MGAPQHVSVSVALSCYDARQYVGQQVDSILAQTRPPDQVVVGDAGSTDGTLDVVLAAADRARAEGLEIEWTILPSERLPLDRNMARIYAACTGDVIVVCDHDDVCLPDRLAHVVDLFTARPGLLFVHCEAEIIDAEGAVTSSSMLRTQGVTPAEREHYRTGDAFRVLVRRFIAHGTTAAFRSELVRLAPPIPPELHHDAWYALLAAAMGGLDLEERTGVRYRTHTTNLSGGVRRRTRREKLHLLLAPGEGRNARLLRQAQALVTGLDAVRPQVTDWAYDLAVDKLRHERARARFPANRALRAPFVLHEARTGAYGRLARGRKDVLLDLVQPTR